MLSRFSLRVRCWLGVLFFSSLILCLWFGHIQQSALNAQPSPPPTSAAQLVQQGVEHYQSGNYKTAIEQWQTALRELQKAPNPANQGIVLQNLARTYHQLGQQDQAIAHWNRVIQLYRQLGDNSQVGRALAEQAQAYSRIGQHRKAIALLCNADAKGHCAPDSALQVAVNARDPLAQVAALGSLGNAYRLIGEYEPAQKNLESSLQIAKSLAKSLGQPTYQISALNSLGVLYTSLAQVSDRQAEITQQSGDTDEAQQLRKKAREYDRQALTYLQQTLELARSENNSLEQLRSLLSTIPVYYRSQSAIQATAAWQQAIRLWQTIPDSSDRVFAAIDLAQHLQSNGSNTSAAKLQCLSDDRLAEAEKLLQQAVAVARRIQDARAESFALGEWGQIYECRNTLAQALELTQQARLAAEQRLDTKDSLYLWEWQTGRILKRMNRETEAIAAYERAIATLESIRGDILTAARDIQFDFRDTIDPIYRELVALKLDREVPIPVATKSLTQTDNQKNFRSILRTVDKLKLAELQNYFGSECVVSVVNQESIDLGAKHAAAIFNTIILDNRTALIVTLPNGQQKFTWIGIPYQELTNKVNEFRRGLEANRKDYDPKPSQQLYDWIIQPFAADLQQAQVNTLVFVQDGIFRTVPMAALHDGQQFLIQKYAIATTPSLTLTDPRPLNRENLRVLALGLTKATTVDGIQFRELPSVNKELAGIRALIPQSKELLDEQFTRVRLKQELSETVYPILHVATHGKFATDPKDTFIVTGDAQKLTFDELDRLIRSVSRNTEPLELLSLTACETAVGNDRSALGLAGVAVQSGARSALASLWSVNDAATAQLSTDFYAQLRNPQVSKAGALQAVQQAFITGKVTVDGVADPSHPAYWSSFVLIGNWL